MDRESLIDAIGLVIKDPFSADTITLKMDTSHGLFREELYLKEMGSPNPRLEMYGNIRCVLIRLEKPKERSAIIFLQADNPSELADIPWVRKAAVDGIQFAGADIDADEAHANAIARILRVVSYLSLRRDILDSDRIFLCGKGIYGVWAMVAAVLDERVSGVMLIESPFDISLPNGQSIDTDLLGGLLCPRPLAILGAQDAEKRFAETIELYKEKGQDVNLRLEAGSSEDFLDAVSHWMLRKEEC